jgi:hypothetical protein
MPRFRPFVPLLAVLVLGGCAALETTAPPVTSAMAGGAGVSTSDLVAGRQLLATRCTSCHSLEPIAKYTPEEWRENVRSMADRSGLNAGEERAITAYLVAARKTLP